MAHSTLQLLDLATVATRQLIGNHRLNPIQDDPDGFRHRHVGSGGTPNLSLGAIDPFSEAPDVALVARFHSATSGFSELKARLAGGDAPSLEPLHRGGERATRSAVWFERDGHIVIPLHVLLHVEGEDVVKDIRIQLQQLVDWAGVLP